MNNTEDYESPRDVLADVIAGNLEQEMQEDNEVSPEDYSRDEWIEAQEGSDEGDGS